MGRRGDGIRFGFATGRVMVLRTRLLGRGEFERLLDAPTLGDQKRILSDTHFGRFVETASTAADVERAIDASLADLFEEFLEKADLPAAVVSYFRTPYDFQALKAVLKSRALGATLEMPDPFLGSVSTEALEVPEALEGALGDVVSAVLGAVPPLDVGSLDALVDRAMFDELARLARSSKVDLLEELAAREADVANAKVLLRCAIGQRGEAAARAMLVPGGRWDASRSAGLVSRPQDLAQAIMVARILPAERAEEMLDPATLDVLADAAIIALAHDATRMAVGPEPVLGYVLARRAEAASVRAVLVGRISAIPRDVLAGRLREVAS